MRSVTLADWSDEKLAARIQLHRAAGRPEATMHGKDGAQFEAMLAEADRRLDEDEEELLARAEEICDPHHTRTLLAIAWKHSIREDPVLPGAIKQNAIQVLEHLFHVASQVVGGMELMYRRGFGSSAEAKGLEEDSTVLSQAEAQGMAFELETLRDALAALDDDVEGAASLPSIISRLLAGHELPGPWSKDGD